MPTVVEIVVLDSSGSAATDRCAELGHDVAQALSEPSVRRLYVVALALGATTTGLEPQPIVERRFEASAAAFEEPGADEAARWQWGLEVVAECDARLRVSDRSPVHTAVVRAVETIRAVCQRLEREGAVCVAQRLRLHSDLRDNVNVAIRDRLYPTLKKNSKKRGALPPLPDPVDLDGITVSVCGSSETRTEAETPSVPVGAIREVWRELLGDNLEIAAGCPRLDRQSQEARQ